MRDRLYRCYCFFFSKIKHFKIKNVFKIGLLSALAYFKGRIINLMNLHTIVFDFNLNTLRGNTNPQIFS